MVHEETKEVSELGKIKKSTVALAEAIAQVRPGETVNEKDFSIVWNKNEDIRHLANGDVRKRNNLLRS